MLEILRKSWFEMKIGLSALGALIGFVIAFIIESASPSGFECFGPTNIQISNAIDLQTGFQSMISCWILLIIISGVCAVVGLAMENLINLTNKWE